MKIRKFLAVLVAVMALAGGLAVPAGAGQLGGGARKQGNPPDRSDVSGAVYNGMLDRTRIVLEITKGDTTFEGRYFYRKYRKSILLKGERLPDGEFQVIEYLHGKPNGAQWLLSASQSEASGLFCQCDVRNPPPKGLGAPLEISLTRVAAGVTYDDLLKGKL